MARNDESIRMVASFLVVNANQTKGATIKEIMEACPTLSRPVVHRILKGPGFKQVVNAAAWPKQYWFDVTESDPFKVSASRKDAPRMTDLQAKALKLIREKPARLDEVWEQASESLVPNGNFIVNFRKVRDAINSEGVPDPKVKDSIDRLARFLIVFGMRLENIMGDPLWDTPEWWRLLKENKNDGKNDQ